MIFKKYKNDIILILVLLTLAGCIWLIQSGLRRHGGEVQICVDGAEIAVLPLDKDAEFILSEANSAFETGSSFENTVIISNGRVCVKAANCPDKLCERQGWIEYNGESIICLPHKLVVTIDGTKAGTDAVAR